MKPKANNNGICMTSQIYEGIRMAIPAVPPKTPPSKVVVIQIVNTIFSNETINAKIEITAAVLDIQELHLCHARISFVCSFGFINLRIPHSGQRS